MWKKSGRSPISQLRSFKVNSKRLNAVISNLRYEGEKSAHKSEISPRKLVEMTI